MQLTDNRFCILCGTDGAWPAATRTAVGRGVHPAVFHRKNQALGRSSQGIGGTGARALANSAPVPEPNLTAPRYFAMP